MQVHKTHPEALSTCKPGGFFRILQDGGFGVVFQNVVMSLEVDAGRTRVKPLIRLSCWVFQVSVFVQRCSITGTDKAAGATSSVQLSFFLSLSPWDM